ncbi:MAG TPA: hypothetical protein VHE59_05110 [Mucilaginibacter sp.]|nr:hypothetical protein [Mucilaginibacter sp.]
MSKASEIKCPHCGEWTLWNGNVDDRCLYCGEFIEPKRFSREVEKRIVREIKKENDYFVIKPGDNYTLRKAKGFMNSFRWTIYYLEIVFFAFISMLLVLLSLFAA